jgi:hypothetical protein
MISDQEKIYNHASNVAKLLLSRAPEVDVIGEIVVRPLLYLLLPLSEHKQRDAVETVRKATASGVLMHVPAILLSASAEFDLAYSADGNSQPNLSRISENDQRAKASSWYQPLIYSQCPVIHSMLHRFFFSLPTRVV